MREEVDKNIKCNSVSQKERFDKSRTKARRYNKEDLDMVKIQSQSNDWRSKKLLPVFKGPFKINKILGHDRYEVTDIKGSERCSKPYTGIVAVENIKPWIKIAHWDNS